MTTSVKVKACCNIETEVKVQVTDCADTFLQHGEEREFFVYGEGNITVSEVPKTAITND